MAGALLPEAHPRCNAVIPRPQQRNIPFMSDRGEALILRRL